MKNFFVSTKKKPKTVLFWINQTTQFQMFYQVLDTMFSVIFEEPHNREIDRRC